MLFGRSCYFSSDDLPLPALGSTGVHMIWIIISIYLFRNIPTVCLQGPWLPVYLAMCIAIFATEMVLLVMIGIVSLRGCVADDGPRRHVIPTIYVFVATAVLETAMHFVGLTMFYLDGSDCPSNSAYNALLMVSIYVYLTSLLVFSVTFTFHLAVGSGKRDLKDIDSPKFWKYCLAPFVCFPLYIRGYSRNALAARAGPSGRPTTILGDVAELFSDLFGDVRLVPSDILVGLILVKSSENRKHQGQVNTESLAVQPIDLTSSNSGSPPHHDWALIVHYFHFAEAIYGFPLYMFAHFSDGLRHLCCPCTSSKPRTASIAVRTYMDDGWSNGCLCCFPASCFCSHPRYHDDLIYVSTTNDLFKSPFMVCFDHYTSSIVIAIRGTLSTTDLLVDLHFRLATIQIPHETRGVFSAQTHHGMLLTAKNIFEELELMNIFLPLLQNPESPYASYRLVCTGHSLGGGVAALLAYLIKSSSRYALLSPRVSAISYAPPGCMITAEGQSYFQTFCTSVVLGDDVIPRLKAHSVCFLKKQIIDELRRCHNYHKTEILTGALIGPMIRRWRRFFRLPDKTVVIPTNAIQNEGFVEHQEHRSSFDPPRRSEADQLCDDSSTTDSTDSNLLVPIYLPGNIIHLRRLDHAHSPPQRRAQDTIDEIANLDEETNANVATEPTDGDALRTPLVHSDYSISWVQPEVFDTIVISRSMGLDHLPNRMREALSSLLRPP
ncbi:hypothetical protein BASA62_010006 [Batrachochytrium salamandrivorans]|nr:hypothetical protein BASA62_010006 [Batrachochytrium salamandrivorans]